MSVPWKKILLYIVLAYAISWSIAGVLALTKHTLTSPVGVASLVIFMFGPLASALLVQKAIYRLPVVRPFRISFRLNWWFLVALLLPPCLALLTLAIEVLLPGISFSMAKLTPPPGQPFPAQAKFLLNPTVFLIVGLLAGMLAGVTVNAVAAFGEELGWRGLMLRELSPLGFWPMSFIIGAVWGLWHAPAIAMGLNYPQHPRLGILLMIVWTMLFSPLFSYITLRADSVIASSILHGTLNGTLGVSAVLVSGDTDLTGRMGLAGMLALLIANIGLIIYDRYISKSPLIFNRQRDEVTTS